jgi:hypothetical protein
MGDGHAWAVELEAHICTHLIVNVNATRALSVINVAAVGHMERHVRPLQDKEWIKGGATPLPVPR